MVIVRSRLAIVLGLGILVLVTVSFFTPWYHVKQDLPLGLESDRQFALEEQITIVSSAGGSGSQEYTSHTSYDNPPDFLKVGNLMQLETALVLIGIVVQALFVMTCFAGARRISLVLGVLSLLFFFVCWVVFFSSVDDAVNSSNWASQPGQGPISGFWGSREVTFLGTVYATSWGPMAGWFLILAAFALQLVAVLRLFAKRGLACYYVAVQHNA